MSALQHPYCVKVRAKNATWTTSAMPEADARQLHARLRTECDAIGEGLGFIETRGTGGREIDVRAREVVSIEVAPWVEPEPPVGAPPGPPGDAQVETGAPPSATEWLRQRTFTSGPVHQ